MKKNNIIIASDNNYAQHLGVTIISIIENSNNKENLCFHILENNINTQNIKNLNLIKEKYNIEINFYSVNDSYLSTLPKMGYVSKATYLRLFSAHLLPQEIATAIYLDCDLVALKDINDIFDYNIGNYGIGAVTDVKSKEIKRIYFYPGIKKYFNAGVLLINLKKWREINISEKSIEFVKEYYTQLSSADQDILNCIFKDDCLDLPRKFNYDPKHELTNSNTPQETVILHYSDKIKPWSYLYVGKNKKYYFKYLNMSPWKDFKYSDKNINNFFKKYFIASKKTLKNLLRPITPKKIIDLNKKIFLKKIQEKSISKKHCG